MENTNSQSMEEFNCLIDLVTLENGDSVINGKTKNLYRVWLKDAFRLGVLTGLRKEEVLGLKWSDAKFGNKSELSYMSLKNNRRMYTVIMTSEIESLLLELGYDKYKNSNKYIIGPEENSNRKFMGEFMCRAFTHFYNQIGNGKKGTFRDLRKIYVSVNNKNI